MCFSLLYLQILTCKEEIFSAIKLKTHIVVEFRKICTFILLISLYHHYFMTLFRIRRARSLTDDDDDD